MGFGRGNKDASATAVEDGSAWIVNNLFADFVLMNTQETLYMCMIGYTFLHGCKVFASVDKAASTSFKFVAMMMACTGGGIIVPIFLNIVPVPLANDSYPIAILISFLLHLYFPILREVVGLSGIVKALLVVLYEALRALVVIKLTYAAGTIIPASCFSFPVFGPIICGAIAGCGGAFLPFNKGLDPIKNGLAAPMVTALMASTCFHLFTHTSLSDGVVDAKNKAHVHIAFFFIVSGLVTAFKLRTRSQTAVVSKVKKEN
uniref:Uncharacterized protein n=1 Tax=Eucampia antarctica TaxID=49252 RepID=A0A7S2S6J3_9STRA|mmetsp:Transcript_3438/g.3254  ORF Transcript_3438/g.3254 Transcript_3438/m.3254 type:complete len:260 (+) Transcript_3438:25-804(+)|eukprot:CAMPEP_0197823144 /NCGR_PEP_ID=MMETSP1437-20131217/466_1 /TAXON_ID=49252 ORGANISM="Eucampia antarctica, Strain CCMP1452" /NCGR_SAMPLE_ID=MMETSP1437 /ASSEMBLY_ACC=CAM_ASM_001096 /LENGTH=259 /DNA_ID=CAMNT_0043422147 /DNA_START=25 /DNA_END=804 /DNA_ORIENTATION=-